MDINKEDINQIIEAGTIDGDRVVLIRTHGGFWAGIRKGRQSEMLFGASHRGLVLHHIAKSFPSFQPALIKSDIFNEKVVELMCNSYLIKNEQNLNIVINSSHNKELYNISCFVENDKLILTNFNTSTSLTPENRVRIVKATTKALEYLNLPKLEVRG